MVNPLFLIILALGTAFLLPLIHRISPAFSRAVFLLVLGSMAALAGGSLYAAFTGADPRILTAGFSPPVSISLRMGREESFAVSAVLTAALLGGVQMMGFWKEKGAGGMAAYLALTLGVTGIIMTRDLFNLFVFLEISAMATYGLIALKGDRKALEGGFKYLMAGGLSSIFFLLGTIYLYRFTGTLNLDVMREAGGVPAGPGGTAALFFLLAALLIELKPFPANGWALDVYEAAPAGVAGILASANAGAIVFALYKILPLLPAPFLQLLTAIGFLSFFAGNLIGLKQTAVRRMLGYSSTAQIGLLSGALGLLFLQGSRPLPFLLIAGGLYINHLLAKAGLFWLAGRVGGIRREEWPGRAAASFPALVMGILIAALAGLPPFPGFWAKWELIRLLVRNGQGLWILLILAGSLFEVIYLMRWFITAVRTEQEERNPGGSVDATAVRDGILPAGLLLALGIGAGTLLGGLETAVLLIPAAGLFFFLVDPLPSRLKALLAMGAVGAWGWYFSRGLSGLDLFFFGLFSLGGLVHLFASLYRKDRRSGHYPLMIMITLSLGALVLARSSLAFFTAWELMAFSSFLLLLKGKRAGKAALPYIAFSLGGAFLLMCGLLLMKTSLSAPVWWLVAAGLLVKTGALGVHLWLPGTYAEAEDDVSSFLSSVLSKAGIFALMVFALRFFPVAPSGLNGPVLGWIGVLTALFATMIAVFQEDIKYMLAWSSLGQVGYILLAFSLMNHAGWTTALYLTLNHSLFKAMLFLAVAGVALRTGTRQMYRMGGLIKKMPLSFLSVLIAIIAVSGVPPLSGFGGKWLLYTALLESGRALQAAAAFFASTVAFLYLFRLIHTVFLGQLKREHQGVKEAPVWLILPQIALMGGVMLFSMYPVRFLQPLADIVSAWYAPVMRFEGGTVFNTLGYWNGSAVMYVTMGVFAAPLIWLLVVMRRPQRVGQFNIVFAAERPDRPETTHFAYNFFAPYRKALGFLARPYIRNFWSGVSEGVGATASMLRRFYTGNGQTYMVHIILFLTLSWFILRGLS